jgi:hypothetical protein
MTDFLTFTLTPDTTSIVVGQSVTLTPGIIEDPTAFTFIPGTTDVTPSLSTSWTSIQSGDGQSSTFPEPTATFTYSSPGTFYPTDLGSYIVSVYYKVNGAQEYCSVCGGYGTFVAHSLPITVSVPEPPTMILMALGFTLLLATRFPRYRAR